MNCITVVYIIQLIHVYVELTNLKLFDIRLVTRMTSSVSVRLCTLPKNTSLTVIVTTVGYENENLCFSIRTSNLNFRFLKVYSN